MTVNQFFPEKRKRLTTTPASWKTEPLPSLNTTISLDRTFSPDEMNLIRMGLLPEEMEDKWFIYWKDETLFFHRSWTGYCVYVVHFVAEADNYRMMKADVNRDPAQYSETDNLRDAKMISYLVDVLLLERHAEFPGDETSPEKKALMNWSEVGRAMFDDHSEEE